MFNSELTITKKDLNITINIDLGNECIRGGVYMFLINDIPLYIGESNVFLARLTYHLQQLLNPQDGSSYFGLSSLIGNYQITYMILQNSYPYIAEKKENNKYCTDKNSQIRKELEWEYIDQYKPLTQRPIFVDSNEILSIRKENKIRKKDDVLPVDYRNKYVKECFNGNIDKYTEIKKLISENHCFVQK